MGLMPAQPDATPAAPSLLGCGRLCSLRLSLEQALALKTAGSPKMPCRVSPSQLPGLTKSQGEQGKQNITPREVARETGKSKHPPAHAACAQAR